MEDNKYLALTAKTIGLIASSSLVLSICYDWGFFFALDINFLDIPTSISDHIRSALIWIPNTLLGFFIILAIEFMTQRIEGGMTEAEIIETSKSPDKTRKFRKSPLVFFRIIAPFMIAGFLFLGDQYRAILPLGLIIIWLMFSEWANNAPLIKIRRSATVKQLFHWLPIVFFSIFFMGYNRAADIATKETAGFLISTLNKQSSLNLNILRNMEKGVLAIDPQTKKMIILPWKSVIAIDVTSPYKPYTGLFGDFIHKKKNETSNQAVQMKLNQQ